MSTTDDIPDDPAPDSLTPDSLTPENRAGHVLDRLFAVIVSRRGADKNSSNTAKLFYKGVAKIAQKVGEEAVETVIEAVSGDKEAVAAESADLLYHLLVLWAARGVRPDAVWAALEARRGESGIAEKARREEED